MTLSKTSTDEFGFTVQMNWVSESGSVDDLGKCQVHETVTEVSRTNPPFTQATVNSGTAGMTISNTNYDHHDYSPSAVSTVGGASGSYTVNQVLTYVDTVLQVTNSLFSDTILGRCRVFPHIPQQMDTISQLR
jgi:hypothetical protein